jgi:aryl carrier-like protein
VPGGGLLQGKSREAAERILAPKVRGALVLADLFAEVELDFFVLTSSITVLLPQVGQADYVAANAFLDAFATLRAQAGQGAGQETVSIGWDAWRETGMALTTEVPEEWKARRRESLAQGLTSHEGVEAFARIVGALGAGGRGSVGSDGSVRSVGSTLPQVVVSTLDLKTRLAENDRLVSLAALEEAAGSPGLAAAVTSAHPRPALATAYVQPQTDLERGIAAAWQEILGVEPIGLHDNFFELGGNSLAGLRLVQRLRERSGAGLSEVSLYEAPTVGALARLIAKQTAAQSGPEEEEAMAGSTSVAGSPAEQESRQRGERRKARLLGRRGTV